MALVLTMKHLPLSQPVLQCDRLQLSPSADFQGTCVIIKENLGDRYGFHGSQYVLNPRNEWGMRNSCQQSSLSLFCDLSNKIIIVSIIISYHLLTAYYGSDIFFRKTTFFSFKMFSQTQNLVSFFYLHIYIPFIVTLYMPLLTVRESGKVNCLVFQLFQQRKSGSR